MGSSGFQVIERTRFVRLTDARGKNNMSPDPEEGRDNNLLRQIKKKYVWFRLHPEKIRVGKYDAIFFSFENFFSWNIQTCL